MASRHRRGAAARRVLCSARKAGAADRSLRRHGVPIAIATDSNPGTSPITSLLLTLNMAATLFGLTVEESHRRRDAEAARALGSSATSARSNAANGATSRSGTSNGRPSSSTASGSIRCMHAVRRGE
jgi:hypothetical protein